MSSFYGPPYWIPLALIVGGAALIIFIAEYYSKRGGMSEVAYEVTHKELFWTYVLFGAAVMVAGFIFLLIMNTWVADCANCTALGR